MQAFSQWAPPGGTLGRIVAEARRRAATMAAREPELRAAALDAPPAPHLSAALSGSTVAVIAEVKRRSPSKGSINPGIDTGAQARAYADGGASALSILTEPNHFGGSVEDLAAARASVSIPLLRKDFLVSSAQLYEARALAPDELDDLAGAAAEVGLETLVEVRDAAELARAIRTPAPLIGVNNRDLETLVMDLVTGDRLVAQIHAGRAAVWESGVSTAADVRRAAAAGADAVLVGSSISAAADPAAAVRALTGVAKIRATDAGARR